MKIEKKELEKSQLELTIELEEKEIEPQLKKAAQKLSAQQKIPGFRPGNAPYDLVKSKFGEMTIYQEALDFIINESFYKAVTQEKLETIGQPKIDIEKLAPGNPVVYKAVVSLLPKITLGQWKTISIPKKEAKASKEDLAKTIAQLQNMNVKETPSDKPAKDGDKVEVDFEVFMDKVLIEGGKSQKYPVVIGAKQMIPGFEEHLIGLKVGDAKEFELRFPEKYFQKNLANRDATFKIKVSGIYERELPKLDDEFAKGLGFETLEKLNQQLEDNINKDKEDKENQRVEIEAIKEIIKISEIAELPENLIDNEIHKMIHELEHNINHQGMDMAGYLKSINKTHNDLHNDFREQAIERVKSALVLRQIAQDEKIDATSSEIEDEIKKQEEFYKMTKNEEALKNLKNPMSKNYIANLIINNKIIKLIKDSIIK